MLTVSLHGIKLHAPVGLYPQEKILGNDFETDVDVWLPDTQPWPYADYTIIQSTVANTFKEPELLLETLVYSIHNQLKASFPFALKIRVAIRKLNPPMPGQVGYAMVCYETPICG